MTSSNAQQPGIKVQPVPIKQTSVTSGKQMFQTYCATCHGTSGVGDGSAAPALKMPPADLTLLTSKNNDVFPQSTSPLCYGSVRPIRPMARRTCRFWSDLFSSIGSRDQASLRIANLTAYIKTLQKK